MHVRKISADAIRRDRMIDEFLVVEGSSPIEIIRTAA
jgi:hypothetical protein